MTLESFHHYLLVFFDLTFLSQMSIFSLQKFESSLEVKRAKRKFSDNFAHNIMELYNVSVQVWSTTNKTKRDIHYSKLGIRVASRAVEWLKTKLSLLQGEKKHIEDLAKKDIKPTQTNASQIYRWIRSPIIGSKYTIKTKKDLKKKERKT